MPVLKIASEFSEAQYQSLIESLFIDDFRNDFMFDIYYYSGTAERQLGFDIEIDSFIPIFLQVKRSHGYLNGSTNDKMTIRNNNFHYNDLPAGYYFDLHLDHRTNDYLQHNLLFNLNFTDRKYARYIAPIFIERRFLMHLKYAQIPIQWNGIFNANMMMYGNIVQHAWRDYTNLFHSILIQPHAILTYAQGIRHKYFFNRNKQISFHSDPIKIDDQNGNLKEFVENLNKDINNLESENKMKLEVIFDFMIEALKSTLKENQYETSECALYNRIIEENTTRNNNQKIDTFGDLTFSKQNFYNLTLYIQKRFEIDTYLAGEKYKFDYL